jgi:hypothetical protein
VLQKAGLSDEADPENYLGGSSKTICITSDWMYTRIVCAGQLAGTRSAFTAETEAAANGSRSRSDYCTNLGT